MTIYEYYLIAGVLIFTANIVLFFANRRLNNKTKALLGEIKVFNECFSSNIVEIGDSTFVNCTIDGQPLTQELADSLMSKRTVH